MGHSIVVVVQLLVVFENICCVSKLPCIPPDVHQCPAPGHPEVHNPKAQTLRELFQDHRKLAVHCTPALQSI